MVCKLSSTGKIDWTRIKKLSDPATFDDLNRFLEKMPDNTGKTILVITGIVWLCAGAIGLYANIQMQHLIDTKVRLEDLSALKPEVPKVQTVPVSHSELKKFVEKIDPLYKNLRLTLNGSDITITSSATRHFTEFRESIGHISNGGQGWRISVKEMCAGKECESNQLHAVISVSRVNISGI